MSQRDFDKIEFVDGLNVYNKRINLKQFILNGHPKLKLFTTDFTLGFIHKITGGFVVYWFTPWTVQLSTGNERVSMTPNTNLRENLMFRDV